MREIEKERREGRKMWERRNKEQRKTKGRAEKEEANGWRVEMREGAAGGSARPEVPHIGQAPLRLAEEG